MSRVKTFKTTLKFPVHFSSFLANHWNKNLHCNPLWKNNKNVSKKKNAKEYLRLYFLIIHLSKMKKRGLVVNTEMYFQIQNYLYSSVNCTLDRCLQKIERKKEKYFPLTESLLVMLFIYKMKAFEPFFVPTFTSFWHWNLILLGQS